MRSECSAATPALSTLSGVPDPISEPTGMSTSRGAVCLGNDNVLSQSYKRTVKHEGLWGNTVSQSHLLDGHLCPCCFLLDWSRQAQVCELPFLPQPMLSILTVILANACLPHLQDCHAVITTLVCPSVCCPTSHDLASNSLTSLT